MSIRAKMKCNHAAIPPNDSTEVVRLHPVVDDENKSWSKWTPGGELTLYINNPPAQGQLKVGESYFVDITPAPAKEADE